ncbi:conserved exported hypothetical protein [Desulfamplus magnetovallimortis]|uniref:FG-GAP repeat protein n=1 Tax=Desulfamplus magnetovallimortis TaxID=1246637 RepID=A0A1W1HAC2_9BACT|nr:hypothetical protein [Desulfamplus magnetovallimortis]SLM29318.1 conserved exported hypothetical protein [Desulfamplus magnetovallimortis]
MKYFKFFTIALSLAAFSCFLNTYTASAEPVKIAITPITIQSAESLDFLEKGIQQMLISRLNILNVSQAEPAPSGDLSLYDTDYILSSNVVLFGESVSTDAVLKDKKTGKILLNFSKTGESKGEVLSHISLLADTVAQKILKQDISVEYTEKTDNTPSSAQQKSTGEAQTNFTAETKYTTTKKRLPEKPMSLWRSKKIESEIASMSVGNVAGGIQNEIITCSDKTVTVFNYSSNQITVFTQFDADANQIFLTVDTADLNNNGVEEIYVTAIETKTLKPQSFILEWKDGGFRSIQKNLQWLFRKYGTNSNDRNILAGQKMNNTFSGLAPGVFKFSMGASGELNGTKLNLPEDINLYSFCYGDATNSGSSDSVAAISLKGNLSVYSPNGELLWEGSDEYGGSKLAINYKGNLYTRDDGFQLTPFYLQQRIMVTDFNDDGSNVVIVVRNSDSTSGLLAKTPIYKKGHIVSLKWNAMGFAPEKSTQTIPGYISDFTVTDLDGDGRTELVFSAVKTEGILSNDISSRIYSMSGFSQNMDNIMSE